MSDDAQDIAVNGCMDTTTCTQSPVLDTHTSVVARANTGAGSPNPLITHQPDDKANVEVSVDPPQTWHTDWSTWFPYMDAYAKRDMQRLAIKETMSRGERNKRILATKKGQRGEYELIPAYLDPYQRVYICTDGRKDRTSRGTGCRPRQHIRFAEYSFRFVVQAGINDGVWQLMVKNGTFIHSHPVNSSAFASLPSSRGVVDGSIEARVDGMLAAGSKRSKIYDYLLHHKQNVIQSDVDNMVRNHIAQQTATDDNGATAAEIVAFTTFHPENVVTVYETEAGEIGVISLSSSHMRSMYSRFSELLLVDCTHKTNRWVYFRISHYWVLFANLGVDLNYFTTF